MIIETHSELSMYLSLAYFDTTKSHVDNEKIVNHYLGIFKYQLYPSGYTLGTERIK